MMTRICFVCLGNVCRSPVAESVFKHLVAEHSYLEEFIIDSAGIGGWNVGKSPDPRSQEVGLKHGVIIDGLARQFQQSDFQNFDLIVAMDRENREALLKMAQSPVDRAKIHLLREYDLEAGNDSDVPDPYYGGIEGFENVYQIIARSCRLLLEVLVNQNEMRERNS